MFDLHHFPNNHKQPDLQCHRRIHAVPLFFRKPFLFHTGPPQVEENLTYQVVQNSGGSLRGGYPRLLRQWRGDISVFQVREGQGGGNVPYGIGSRDL